MDPKRKIRITRDGLLFCLGSVGFLHELLVSGTERPFIIGACLGMMGLPAFLGWDEAKQAPPVNKVSPSAQQEEETE